MWMHCRWTFRWWLGIWTRTFINCKRRMAIHKLSTSSNSKCWMWPAIWSFDSATPRWWTSLVQERCRSKPLSWRSWNFCGLLARRKPCSHGWIAFCSIMWASWQKSTSSMKRSRGGRNAWRRQLIARFSSRRRSRRRIEYELKKWFK